MFISTSLNQYYYIILLCLDQDMVITVLSLVSRMFSSCGICGSNLYIGEIFPTSIRQMALGSAATVSALISIAAPLVGGTLVSGFKPGGACLFDNGS